MGDSPWGDALQRHPGTPWGQRQPPDHPPCILGGTVPAPLGHVPLVAPWVTSHGDTRVPHGDNGVTLHRDTLVTPGDIWTPQWGQCQSLQSLPIGINAGSWGHTPLGTPGYPTGASASLQCHNPRGQYQPYGDMQVPHGDTQAPCWGHCRALGSRSMGTPWGHLDTPGGSMPILGVRPHGDTQAPHWGHCQPPQLPPPPPRGHPGSTGDTQTPLGDTAGPRGHSALGTPGSPPHSQPVLPLGMSKSPSVSPPPGGARIPLWVPPPPLGTPPMCLQCPTAALPPLYKPLPCKYRTMYIAAAAGGGGRGHGDTGTQGRGSHPSPSPPLPPPRPLFYFFSLPFRSFGPFSVHKLV